MFVMATIGFVAIIIAAAFIMASNIRNLIGVIRHLSYKTSRTFSSLSTTAKESYEEAVPEAKDRKKPEPEKKEKSAPVAEEPLPTEEDEFEKSEADIAKRVEEMKDEIQQEEVAKEQPKTVPVTEAPKPAPQKPAAAPATSPAKYDGLGDDELDKLLGGK